MMLYLKIIRMVKNSTSVITYVKRTERANFHFDIGLIKVEHNGQAYRLVYDNSSKVNLIWNKSFKSKKLNKRAKEICRYGAWNKLRNRYLQMKNVTLVKQNETSSYSLYAQAINDVYQQIKERFMMAKYSNNDHSKAENDNRSNQMTPNNAAHNDNRSNQMNPNNSAYKASRK